MAHVKPLLAASLMVMAAASPVKAAILENAAVHGSVQADILFPEEDEAIGTGTYDKKILFNSYADVSLVSKYVDAGLRLEFMKWPLPGYEPDFAGWGVPNIFIKAKCKGVELTAGDFYEQFGSGFILRTYEQRALGIDNSIRGGRLKINSINGLRITALGGLQRRYWDWHRQSQVYGGDVEAYIQDWAPRLRDKGVMWSVGASYVLKHESDEDIMVPGTNYRLNLPTNVNAFDGRTHFQKGNWGVMGEFAWKSQDPSFDNNYTYGDGTAYMITGTYSRPGMSALIQAKRSDNMAFRSQRDMSGNSTFINNMPAFSYQHTYALAAMYPYATQNAPGEWAFQGSFAYSFKRKTALGGKYGTKVKVNLSYISGLVHKPAEGGLNGNTLMGSNGESAYFWKIGQENYHDFNITIEKRLSRSFMLQFLYMNQFYNQSVVEGHGDKVKSNIFVLDGNWKIDRKFNLRAELQYLTTREDKRDWAYGLVEFTYNPWLMFSISDMWNCGNPDGEKTHYYMFGITGNYKANRLMVSYGRTKAGFNCSGGVCRWVPASRGFQVNYTYNF